MNNSPYKGNLPINTPLICITKYIENGVTCHGLSIRFYAGHDEVKGHKVFSSGKSSINNPEKVLWFSDFVAVVKYDDFDPIVFRDNPKYHLHYYKVQNYG